MKVSQFYSVEERYVFHNDDQCGPGKEIPLRNRAYDAGGISIRRLCKECAAIKGLDKLRADSPYQQHSSN